MPGSRRGTAKEGGWVGFGWGELDHGTTHLAVEDHGAARAAERLVRGGGDDVGGVEGRRDHLGRHEAADVRHVGEHVGAVLVADGANAVVVNEPRVRRRARHDELRAVELRVGLHRVVVDDAGLVHEAVREGLEVGAHGGDLLGRRLVAVRQVAAGGQVQCHDAVLRLQHGRVGLEVGRRPGQRLHVDTPLLRVQVEGLQRAVLAQGLHLIDVLVAAVVPRPGVALTVFVRHDRAQRVEDRLAREVLARDEHQRVPLAALLVLDEVVNRRVRLLQALVQSERGHRLARRRLGAGGQRFRGAGEEDTHDGSPASDSSSGGGVCG